MYVFIINRFLDPWGTRSDQLCILSGSGRDGPCRQGVGYFNRTVSRIGLNRSVHQVFTRSTVGSV